MKKVILALVAVFSMITVQAQTQVGDVTLPNTMSIEGTKLVLNGAGIREKMWFDLYSGGLYLGAKSSDENAILASDATMAIKLHITSKLITSSKMISAVNDGFKASTNGNVAPMASKIAKFTSFFNEEIVAGTIFDIANIKGKGVVVYRNGEQKGMIEGDEFRKALFGIWLGADPADEDLKAAMLKG